MFSRRDRLERRKKPTFKVITAHLYGFWKITYKFEAYTEALKFIKNYEGEWKMLNIEGETIDCSLNYKN